MEEWYTNNYYIKEEAETMIYLQKLIKHCTDFKVTKSTQKLVK